MHAPCSNYRSILSSGSYYLEDFDYRSILVDSGIIVQWSGFLVRKEGRVDAKSSAGVTVTLRKNFDAFQ